MKISIVTKVRAGFSTAIIVTLVIAEMVTGVCVDIRQRNGVIVCIALGLTGFLIWATSWLGKAELVKLANQAVPAGEPNLEDPLAPFKSRRYWGMMMVHSAVILAAASAYRFPPPKPKPVASVSPAKPIVNIPAPQPVVTIAPPKPVVVFPRLKLQTLIVHGTHSTAEINGKVLMIGEEIQGVRLVGVNGEHATVELDGQTNVLSLSK